MQTDTLPSPATAQNGASTWLSDRKTEAVAAIIRSRARGRIAKLLVVGCGKGREAGILANQLGVPVIGIDIQNRFDPRAQAVADLRIGDALAMEFPDASFDFVYSYHALEHFSDPGRALREMRRVLRPGGNYVIGTPNRLRLVGYLGSARTSRLDKIRWNLSDWKARLRGRFRNEYGAHAGFSRKELAQMLTDVFQDADDITAEYYQTLYRGQSRTIAALERTGLSQLAFPSVYFFGLR